MILWCFLALLVFFVLSSIGGARAERVQKPEPWAPELGVLYSMNGGLKMRNNLGHVWVRDSFDSEWRISENTV